MAITYSTAMKTARMQATANDIDEGTGAGTLEIGTTAFATTLVTFTLTEPCGSVSGDTLTFDFDPDISNTASAAGTAAEARIKDGNGVIVISGLTVGTSGTDLIIDNTSIANGQTVVLATGSIQHAT